jgi:hypothetical protein
LLVAVVVVLSVQTMETTVAVLVTAARTVVVLEHSSKPTQETACMVARVVQMVPQTQVEVLVGMLMDVMEALGLLAVRV